MRSLKRKVNFDICTFCNHACTFCSNSDSRTIKSQIDEKSFVRVMQNLSRYVEIEEMGLSAKGEVLINKDLEKIIKRAKEEFGVPYLYFSTNGALLDPRRALGVLEAGIDSIKFSINATDATSYRQVHQADDFDRVIANLKNLIWLKRTRFPKLKIMISAVIDLDREELEERFRQLLGEDFQAIDRLSLYRLTYTPKFEAPKREVSLRNRCRIPFDEIYINSDGTLGLCCKDYFDEVNFGSLMTDDFLSLYNSREFEKVRGMHRSGEFSDAHLCKKCLQFEG